MDTPGNLLLASASAPSCACITSCPPTTCRSAASPMTATTRWPRAVQDALLPGLVRLTQPLGFGCGYVPHSSADRAGVRPGLQQTRHLPRGEDHDLRGSHLQGEVVMAGIGQHIGVAPPPARHAAGVRDSGEDVLYLLVRAVFGEQLT